MVKRLLRHAFKVENEGSNPSRVAIPSAARVFLAGQRPTTEQRVQLSLTHALTGAWLGVADIGRLRPDVPSGSRPEPGGLPRWRRGHVQGGPPRVRGRASMKISGLPSTGTAWMPNAFPEAWGETSGPGRLEGVTSGAPRCRPARRTQPPRA